MLTSVITANTTRDANSDETMRPMTNTEIRGIILDGIGGGTDTVSKKFIMFIKFLQ
jgi:hypothetical protein